jgi:hypothetical protein
MIERVWLAAILLFGGLFGVKTLLLAVGAIRNRWHRRQIADGHRSPLVIDRLGWNPPFPVEEEEAAAREVDLIQAMGSGQAGALTSYGVYTLDAGEARVAATLEILRALEGDPVTDFEAPQASIPAEEVSPGRLKRTGLRSRIAAALQERVWSSMEAGLLDLEEVPRRHGRIWDPRKAS